MKICIVDDDEMVAEIGKIMLEGLGYKATFITNSLEALERLCHHSPAFDLVITDYNMPYMNGVQLALQVHKIHKDLPILLATGNKDITEENLQQWGINGLISKPYQINKIASLIDQFCNPLM